jgi:DNA processing protein
MIGVGRGGSPMPAGSPGPGRDGPDDGAAGAVRSPREVAAAAASRARDAWAVLAATPGLGPVGLVAVVSAFGDAPGVLDAAATASGTSAIAEVIGRRAGDPAVLAARIAASASAADGILGGLRRLGLDVMTIDDADYPPLLAATELPPPVLFILGPREALSGTRTVAVVGTRRPTDAGRAVASRISGAIARCRAAVVSGLAVGIDGAAHAAAVGVSGTTIAVIGGGHDRAVPRPHRALADRIVEAGGAVVSEHAPGTSATRGTFPRRNRVISGLAEATIVVEAGRRSGALITAGWALEQGRECYLVPGPLGAVQSEGCLAYLRAYAGQARIVAGVPELLEDLGLVPDEGSPTQDARRGTPVGAAAHAVLADLPAVAAAIARWVAGGSRSTDELMRRTGLPVASVLAAVTLLEDRGLVRAAYGRYHLAGELVDLE